MEDTAVIRKALRWIVSEDSDNNHNSNDNYKLLTVTAYWNRTSSIRHIQKITDIFLRQQEQHQQKEPSILSNDCSSSLDSKKVSSNLVQIHVSKDMMDDELEKYLIEELACPEKLPALGIYGVKEDKVHWISEFDSVLNMSDQWVLDDEQLVLDVINMSMDRCSSDSNMNDNNNNIPKPTTKKHDCGSIASVTTSAEIIDVNTQEQEPKNENKGAIRIFVAGDKSQVGKSTVCLGLLGSFLNLGYPASKLAYIKPATQCEEQQLVTTFCEANGIACVPVGPIVYFKGFTRAFLSGNTESSEKLLSNAAAAVDELAKGKDIVIVDGVGYPSVGSICGTSNADVALSCGPLSPIGQRLPMPVLLIGKSGVGDAVDSFNLNATFFETKGIPVVGCIFNRLSLDGFYSYRNCKESVDQYFALSRPTQMPFGYIPDMSNDMYEGMTPFERSELLITAFSQHVDVQALIDVSRSVCHRETSLQPAKRQKLNHKSESFVRPLQITSAFSREQIESSAKAQGASGG